MVVDMTENEINAVEIVRQFDSRWRHAVFESDSDSEDESIPATDEESPAIGLAFDISRYPGLQDHQRAFELLFSGPGPVPWLPWETFHLYRRCITDAASKVTPSQLQGTYTTTQELELRQHLAQRRHWIIPRPINSIFAATYATKSKRGTRQMHRDKSQMRMDDGGKIMQNPLLVCLPVEVLLYLFEFLPYNCLLTLMATSRSMYCFVRNHPYVLTDHRREQFVFTIETTYDRYRKPKHYACYACLRIKHADAFPIEYPTWAGARRLRKAERVASTAAYGSKIKKAIPGPDDQDDEDVLVNEIYTEALPDRKDNVQYADKWVVHELDMGTRGFRSAKSKSKTKYRVCTDEDNTEATTSINGGSMTQRSAFCRRWCTSCLVAVPPSVSGLIDIPVRNALFSLLFQTTSLCKACGEHIMAAENQWCTECDTCNGCRRNVRNHFVRPSGDPARTSTSSTFAVFENKTHMRDTYDLTNVYERNDPMYRTQSFTFADAIKYPFSPAYSTSKYARPGRTAAHTVPGVHVDPAGNSMGNVLNENVFCSECRDYRQALARSLHRQQLYEDYVWQIKDTMKAAVRANPNMSKEERVSQMRVLNWVLKKYSGSPYRKFGAREMVHRDTASVDKLWMRAQAGAIIK